MSQKNQLNLVSLYQRQEEMSESEMNVVFAGAHCPCGHIDLYDYVYDAENPPESCHCGSLWNIFGLAWGYEFIE
jgi:hypothetical protein